ncbi:hypothetical protein SB717_38535, partial [Priestia sp. SIMBA_032]
GATAQRRSRAGKQDRPISSRDHPPCGRLRNEQPRQTTNSPASLEIGRINVEDVGPLESTGIEHDKVRLAQIAVNTSENASD